MQIAIPLFDGITALDAVGPYEVLSRLPGATVRFVGEQARPYRTETGMLALTADARLDELPGPEVVVVPGGIGARRLLDGSPLVDWVCAAHAGTTWTASVCTGSLVLGAAGVLDGLPATSHWSELETLARYGATPTAERVVRAGKVITAAGVSAGIDMALALAAELAGRDVAEAIQLGIEYDPQPPFAGGSLASARPEIVARVRDALAASAPA